MFEAEGSVTVDGRAAGNVTVSFAVTGRRRLPFGREVPAPVRTDKRGRFIRGGFVDGLTYAATASAPGVTFRPARVTFDVDDPRVALTGTVATFSASGVVREPPGLLQRGKPPGIGGVSMTFVRIAGRSDRPVPAPVTTAADGTWRQTGFQLDSVYLAVPAKSGLAFNPPTVALRPGASVEVTGSSSVFSIGGRVTTAGGAVEPGVTLRFTRTSGVGSLPAAVTTDGAGAFMQFGFDRTSRYRVTPSKRGQTFDPSSHEVAFAPNALPVRRADFQRRTNLVVTGQVLTTAGAGLLSTMLTFTRVRGSGAVPLPVITGSNGEYRAAGLDAGTTYRVTGARDGFGVVPAELRAAAGGTAVLNLTAFPAFDVAGVVVDAGGPIADLAALQRLLDDGPPLAGALVSFTRGDDRQPVPSPVVTAADGTFHQRGFGLDGRFVATATRSGFVGATLLPLGGLLGGSAGGGSMSFSSPHAGLLDGIVLILQRD
jgi:hypothetical protein